MKKLTSLSAKIVKGFHLPLTRYLVKKKTHAIINQWREALTIKFRAT